MWTDHDTLSTLDTQIGHPDWDFQSDVTLFPLGRPGGECAVYRERRDRDIVAVEANNLSEDIVDEFWCSTRDRLSARDLGSDLRWNFDLIKILKGAIHCFKVFLNDRFTT